MQDWKSLVPQASSHPRGLCTSLSFYHDMAALGSIHSYHFWFTTKAGKKLSTGVLDWTHPYISILTHILIYLSTWSPGGRTVWEGLVGVTLLERCVTDGGLWVFTSPYHSQLEISLPPIGMQGCKLSDTTPAQCLLPIAMLPGMTIMDLLSQTVSKPHNRLFRHDVSSQQYKSN